MHVAYLSLASSNADELRVEIDKPIAGAVATYLSASEAAQVRDFLIEWCANHGAISLIQATPKADSLWNWE